VQVEAKNNRKSLETFRLNRNLSIISFTFAGSLAVFQESLDPLDEIVLFLLEVAVSNKINRFHLGQVVERLE
jgi:hypothetical protein